jgi:hypothetical protein
VREKKDPILIFDTGMIYAAQGRTETLQIIKELEEMSGTNLSQAHYVAKLYAVMKEKEMAFSCWNVALSGQSDRSIL